MNYRSFNDLNININAWTYKLPDDLDVIVGVPRSGLLVANLLALRLNIPMTDVEGFVAGRFLTGGPRLRYSASSRTNKPRMHALVVDDSVWSGKEMAKARARIEASGQRHRVTYAAVYAEPGGIEHVDLYYQKVVAPRVFEWNVLHHPLLATGCIAFEDVLWPEADETRHLNGRNSAMCRPLFRPSCPVGWIVTTQPQDRRRFIEDWLAYNDIVYEGLEFVAPVGAGQNRTVDDVCRDKGRLYRRKNASLFIEARADHAALVARAAKKPVFSYENGRMTYRGALGQPRYTPPPTWLAWRSLRGVLARFYKRFIPPTNQPGETL